MPEPEAVFQLHELTIDEYHQPNAAIKDEAVLDFPGTAARAPQEAAIENIVLVEPEFYETVPPQPERRTLDVRAEETHIAKVERIERADPPKSTSRPTLETPLQLLGPILETASQPEHLKIEAVPIEAFRTTPIIDIIHSEHEQYIAELSADYAAAKERLEEPIVTEVDIVNDEQLSIEKAPTLGQLMEDILMKAVEPEEDDGVTSETEPIEIAPSSGVILESLAGQISLLEEDQFEAANDTFLEIIDLVIQAGEVDAGNEEQIAVLTEKIEVLCMELLEKLNIKYDEESLKILIASLIGEVAKSEDASEEPAKNIWYEGMHEITAGQPADFTSSLAQHMQTLLPKHTKLVGNIALAAMI